MASWFQRHYPSGFRLLEKHLSVAARLTRASDGSTADFDLIFDEQVGFVDALRRGVAVMADALTPRPDREDRITLALDGHEVEYVIVNVKQEREGALEIRADARLERI